jgi:hypothetical protein
MMFCDRRTLVLVLGTALTAAAQEPAPLLGTNERAHLDRALDALNMTEGDLGFMKDVAEPLWAPGWVRQALKEPLRLPAIADRFRAAVATNDPAAVWALAGELLETEEPAGGPAEAGTANQARSSVAADVVPSSGGTPELEGRLAESLGTFAQTAAVALRHLTNAFAGLTLDARQYLAACTLAGTFNAEDRPEVVPLLEAAGLPSQVVAKVIAEGLELDPRPSATNYFAQLSAMRFDELLAAGAMLQGAAARLADEAAGVKAWPTNVTRLATAAGTILVGTPRADTYDEAALLILDPGGDDRYGGAAGQANGLAGVPVACVVDLAGDDLYEGRGILGPGSALFGAACTLDGAGNDVYRAAYAGQAAALFGAAWLEDRGGDDEYRASAYAQAAAVAGVAVLRDRAGADRYEVGLQGQAYAGVRGFALLADDGGEDTYTSGGREPDYERYPERFLSLAQGCAVGARPFLGGGAAALVDRAGNDVYVADVYGQGVGYWYSAGFLLDGGGHDTYRLYHYGQGSGIHLSLGLLADEAGDDTYSGFGLVQGNAHDYAVGMLFDRAGRDTYTAESSAHGRAIHNALAVLVEGGGDDGYFGRLENECQGIGHDGGLRDYGSLSLLLDLGGADRYTFGATNGVRLLRPLYGIVYDAD